MKISESYANKIKKEDRFERLVYLHITTEKSGMQPKWVARCDCGSLVLTVRGGAHSCGCLREDKVRELTKVNTKITPDKYHIMDNKSLTDKERAHILGVSVATVRRLRKKLRNNKGE